jgi:hypothetical protein
VENTPGPGHVGTSLAAFAMRDIADPGNYKHD